MQTQLNNGRKYLHMGFVGDAGDSQFPFLVQDQAYREGHRRDKIQKQQH